MKPVGCLECRDTGYLGRMGVYEIMLLTESLRGLIRGDTDIDTLRRQGLKDGMRSCDCPVRRKSARVSRRSPKC